MGFSIKISPVAQRNIRAAVRYYLLNVSEKVASLFLEDLESSLETLTLNPYFQKIYGQNRSLPLKKFPFILIFTIDENEKIIRLKAVFHTSQNPEMYPE
jgi:toxin ParE1/3/4